MEHFADSVYQPRYHGGQVCLVMALEYGRPAGETANVVSDCVEGISGRALDFVLVYGCDPCCWELDTRTYPKGIKVSNDEMAILKLKDDTFHPEWNYTVSSRLPP